MPHPGMSPDNAPTAEAGVIAEYVVRDVAEQIVNGASFRQIGRQLGMDHKTAAQLARRVREMVNEETRAELAVWQAQKFHEMQEVLARLKPFVSWDYAREAAGEPQLPPNEKLLSQYWNGLKTVVIVMTADRTAASLPELVEDTANAAVEKAKHVQTFIELADKVVAGIAEGGYGSGIYESIADDEDELDLQSRADNSDTVADAVVLDGSAGWVESDLDSTPGEWRDGKFYPADRGPIEDED